MEQRTEYVNPVFITDKLFAQICADTFLKGYKLEGECLRNTAGFLSNYLATTDRKVSNLSSQLNKLVEIIRQEITAPLLENICQQVNQLQQNQSLLLPGGYAGMPGEPGHAMIYEWKKTPAGDLLFKIYNSGEGLTHHPSTYGLYNPVLTYKIPKTELEKPDFNKYFKVVVQQLLEAQKLGQTGVPKHNIYNADDLYKTVIEKIRYLGADLETSPMGESFLLNLTRGQLSGTCAENVLHELLKEQLPLNESIPLIYQFKAYTLEKYINDVLGGEEKFEELHPQQKKLLRKGIKSNLRFLQRIPEEFGHAFKEKEMQKLALVLLNLSMKQPRIPTVKTPIQINTLTIETPPIFTVGEIKSNQQSPEKHETNAVVSCGSMSTTDFIRSKSAPASQNILENLSHKINYIDCQTGCTAIEELKDLIFYTLPLPDNLDNLQPPYNFLQDNIDNTLQFVITLSQIKELSKNLFVSYMSSPDLKPIANIFSKHIELKLTLLGFFALKHLPLPPKEQVVNKHKEFLKDLLTCFPSKDEWLSVERMASYDPHIDADYIKMQTLIEKLNTQLSSQETDPEQIEFAELDFIKEIIDAVDKVGYLNKSFTQLRKDELIQASPENKSTLQYLYHYLENNDENYGGFKYQSAYVLLKKLPDPDFIYSLQPLPQQIEIICQVKSLLGICTDSDLKNMWHWSHNYIDGFSNKEYSGVQERQRKFKINLAIDAIKKKSSAVKTNTPNYYENLIEKISRLLISYKEHNKNGYIKKTHDARDKYNTDSRVMLLETDRQFKDLILLRSVRETQVRQTLDYFLNHLELLNINDIQQYLEENLFQPGLLSTELHERYERFNEQFTKFINSGMEFHKKINKLTKVNLFLVHLFTRTAQYIAKDRQLELAVREKVLLEALAKINIWVSESDDETIKSNLSKFRLIISNELLQINPNALQEKPFLESYLKDYFESSAEDKEKILTVEDSYEIAKNRGLAYEYLKTIPKDALSQEKLSNALKTIVHLRPEIKIDTHSFPIVAAQECQIVFNFQQGIIYYHQFQKGPLPDELKHHNLIKYFHLLGPGSSYRGKMDGAWEISNGSITLHYENRRYLISGLPGLESDLEYEIIPHSDRQKNKFNLESPCNLDFHLSDTITETDTFVLIPKDLVFKDPLYKIVLFQDNKVILTGTVQSFQANKAQISWQDQQGRHLLLGGSLYTDHYMHLIGIFKIEYFSKVNIYWRDAPPGYDIEFPRYGLQFQSERLGTDPNAYKLTFMNNGTKYDVVDEGISCIDSKVPVVMLNNPNTQEQLVILPVCQFLLSDSPMPSSTPMEHHLHYQLDIEGIIGLSLSDPALFWKHAGSRCNYVIKYRDGKFYPENSEQTLYLAYLYLGTDKPHKAWEMLTLCDQVYGGIKGTALEIEYFQWITHSLPQSKSLVSDKSIDKKKVQNPQTVACQLKALSFITRLDRDKIQYGKQIDPPQTQNDNDSNQHYQKRRAFIDKLYKDINKLYNRQLHIEKEYGALANYKLSHAERFSLLNFCKIKYEYEKHKALKKLVESSAPTISQIEKLQVIKNNYGLSPFMQKEYKSLHKKILGDNYSIKPVQFIDGFIKPVLFDITEDFFKRINYDRQALKESNSLDASFFSQGITSLEDQKSAMDELLDTISPQTIMKNFWSYIDIAANTESEHHERLMYFCEHALLSYRKFSRESPIRFLAGVLEVIAQSKILNLNIQLRESYIQDLEEHQRLLATQKPQPDTPPTPLTEVFLNFLICSVIDLAQEDTYQKKIVPFLDLVSETNEFSIDDIRPLAPKPKSPTPSTEELSFLFENIRSQLVSVLRLPKQLDNPTSHLPIIYNGSFFALGKEFSKAQLPYAQLKTKKLTYEDSLNERLDLQKETLNALKKLTNASIKQYEEEIQNLMQNLSFTHKLTQFSNTSTKLDFDALLLLYFHNDINRYREATGFSDELIDELHKLLTLLLQCKTSEQQMTRCLDILEKFDLSKSSIENSITLRNYVEALNEKNYINAKEDPALSLFQFKTNKLIRLKNVTMLKKLLSTSFNDRDSFLETIEKIIMGGGKTKVILPSLVSKKSNGKNLVILEVPRALLQTCYADLRATSLLAFDQDAFMFEFNRSSDHSPKALRRLYTKFLDASQNKQYMVTTSEALQSLELKYFNLLQKYPTHSTPQEKQDWEKSVDWLTKILKLLRTQGELMIDEVHDSLQLKNKLNYTLGEPQALNIDVIKHASALYKFIDSKIGLRQILLATSTPEEYDACNEYIVKYVMSDAQSPLLELKSKFQDIEKLHNYLLNKSSLPEAIPPLTVTDMECLSFFKAEFSLFLPATLKRKYRVHYGESQDTNTPADERALAIPYRANNQPKYGSQFSNEIETLNYTIQSMLIAGIAKELFLKLLHEWLATAKKEILTTRFQSSPTIGIDTTSIGAWFKLKTGVSLESLDYASDEVIDNFFNTYKNDRDFIFKALENNVLNKIRLEPALLHSDAYTHVDMVHSCQGISGTPWNESTFHQRLKYNPDPDECSDGMIVQALMDTGKTKLIGENFNDTTLFIQTILKQASPTTKAMIDINATFNGVDNESVAMIIAKNVNERFSKIKYVLYFNKYDQLAALSVTEPEKEPIIIGQSDPKIIQQKLNGATPNECFTFYDQSHTIGADIAQSPDANALTLIDHTTQLSSFLQGVMRMRGLVELEQTVEVIMPKTFLEQILKTPEISLSSSSTLPSSDTPLSLLIQELDENEKQQLKIDNFHATVSKIYNALRNDLCQRIIHADNATQRRVNFIKYEQFFIHHQDYNMTNRFGEVSGLEETSHLLQQISATALKDWKELVSCSEDDSSYIMMQQALNKIIEERGNCERVQQVPPIAVGQTVEKETEQEQAQQKEQQQQKEEQKDHLLKGKKCPKYRSMTQEEHDNRPLVFSLNAVYRTDIFDDTLGMTSNFCFSFKSDNFEPIKINKLNQALKPVLALYFSYIEGRLHCQLLTQQECREIYSTINAGQPNSSWMSTTTHTVLAGQPPKDIIDNKDYQRLIMQARYFNGEFDALLADKEPTDWLSTEPDTKIEWFKKNLLPWRETALEQLERLALQYPSKTPDKKTPLFFHKTPKKSQEYSSTTIEDSYPPLLEWSDGSNEIEYQLFDIDEADNEEEEEEEEMSPYFS